MFTAVQSPSRLGTRTPSPAGSGDLDAQPSAEALPTAAAAEPSKAVATLFRIASTPRGSALEPAQPPAEAAVSARAAPATPKLPPFPPQASFLCSSNISVPLHLPACLSCDVKAAQAQAASCNAAAARAAPATPKLFLTAMRVVQNCSPADNSLCLGDSEACAPSSRGGPCTSGAHGNMLQLAQTSNTDGVVRSGCDRCSGTDPSRPADAAEAPSLASAHAMSLTAASLCRVSVLCSMLCESQKCVVSQAEAGLQTQLRARALPAHTHCPSELPACAESLSFATYCVSLRSDWCCRQSPGQTQAGLLMQLRRRAYQAPRHCPSEPPACAEPPADDRPQPVRSCLSTSLRRSR